MVLKFENLKYYGKYWFKKEQQQQKFNRKKIDAKVTFCYITIFCAAEVVSSPKHSLNTIILTFYHSEHQ